MRADETQPFEFQPLSIELETREVDPDLLGLLTGGVLGNPLPKPTFAIEVHHPIKRTFWQWLTRKPKKWRTIHIPNARISESEGENTDG